jgi:hypothetical protein
VRRLVVGLSNALHLAGPADAVTVERRGDTLRIASLAGVAKVRLDRYRLTGRGPGWRREGHIPTADAAVLDVHTSEGGTAQVELAWRTDRTVECTIGAALRNRRRAEASRQGSSAQLTV